MCGYIVGRNHDSLLILASFRINEQICRPSAPSRYAPNTIAGPDRHLMIALSQLTHLA